MWQKFWSFHSLYTGSFLHCCLLLLLSFSVLPYFLLLFRLPSIPSFLIFLPFCTSPLISFSLLFTHLSLCALFLPSICLSFCFPAFTSFSLPCITSSSFSSTASFPLLFLFLSSSLHCCLHCLISPSASILSLLLSFSSFSIHSFFYSLLPDGSILLPILPLSPSPPLSFHSPFFLAAIFSHCSLTFSPHHSPHGLRLFIFFSTMPHPSFFFFFLMFRLLVFISSLSFRPSQRKILSLISPAFHLVPASFSTAHPLFLFCGFHLFHIFLSFFFCSNSLPSLFPFGNLISPFFPFPPGLCLTLFSVCVYSGRTAIHGHGVRAADASTLLFKTKPVSLHHHYCS